MKRMAINDKWTFSRSDGSSLGALSGAAIETITVNLPHDASISTTRDGENSTSGNGFFKEENYVYTKKIVVDEADKLKQFYLEFEGIYQNAFIYVNGSFMGKHPYGYTSYVLDVTDAIRFDKENEIKVIAKNEGDSGRWYTGGGIYRPVYMMVADRTHICASGAKLSTIEIQDGLAILSADVEIEHTESGMRTVKLEVKVYDDKGTEVACNNMMVTLTGNSKGAYNRRLYINNPETWDDKNPYLYTYEVRILDGGRVIDEDRGTFGVRTLSLDPINGLQVNGKTVLLRGTCIHHDNGIIGAVEFAEAADRRVKKLKEAGFNAIRSSHYPISVEMLRACDKYGMYVMDEFSDVWTSHKVVHDYSCFMSEYWERDIESMVHKDFNHPCVVMYSIGNEIPEVGNKIDRLWGKKIADKVKSMDSTRFTINSINTLLAAMTAGNTGDAQADGGQNQEINSAMSSIGELMSTIAKSPMITDVIAESCDQVDIIGYNYAAVRYEMEADINPNHIVVGSETFAKDLYTNWELVKKLPNVIGDFDWTGWDYLGETGIGGISYGDNQSGIYLPYPYKAAYCGDINLIGDRLPISYWREIVWGLRDKPYICAQPPMYYGKKKNVSGWSRTDAIHSWNFKEFDGKNIVVETYTDADEAALYINNQLIEKKTVGEVDPMTVYFDTVYSPGIVEVVVYKNGIEVGRDKMVTALDAVTVKADVSKNTICADGSDIAFIELSLVDEKGNLNPEVVKNICVNAEGVSVMGLGSASPNSEENYYDVDADTYEGRLLAVIRGCGKAGSGKVTFSVDGLDDIIVEIRCD